MTAEPYLSVVDVGVDDEVAGGVAESEVVLGELRLAGVKSQLVAQKPSLKEIADHKLQLATKNFQFPKAGTFFQLLYPHSVYI